MAYQKIWSAVKSIPRGKVATYGQVAAIAGFPKQARMAGYALFNCPSGSPIPWFRVINAQGRVSLPPRSTAARKQRAMLKKEGVTFIGGRVNLARYRWQPQSPSPLLD